MTTVTSTYSLIDEMMASATEPMPTAHFNHQIAKMWDGLGAMTHNQRPTLDHWRIVLDALNMMEVLVCDMHLCEDTNGLLQDSIAVLARAKDFDANGHKFRISQPDAKVLQALLEDYSEVLKALPYRTMIRCHRIAERQANVQPKKIKQQTPARRSQSASLYSGVKP